MSKAAKNIGSFDAKYRVETSARGIDYICFMTREGTSIRIPLAQENAVVDYFTANQGHNVYQCNLATLIRPIVINHILDCTPDGRAIVQKGYVGRTGRGILPGWARALGANNVKINTDFDPSPSRVVDVAEGLALPALRQTTTVIREKLIKQHRYLGGFSKKRVAQTDETLGMVGAVMHGYEELQTQLEDSREDTQNLQAINEQHQQQISTLLDTINNLNTIAKLKAQAAAAEASLKDQVEGTGV